MPTSKRRAGSKPARSGREKPKQSVKYAQAERHWSIKGISKSVRKRQG